MTWDDRALTRPLTSAEESYKDLIRGARTDGGPPLTVTGAKLGEMNVEPPASRDTRSKGSPE